jgi:hypothetical protein
VQTVVRNMLSPGQQRQWAGIALRLLLVAFPSDCRDPQTWPVAQRLLPHTLQAAEFNEVFDTDPRSVALLLQRLGNYLEQRAQTGGLEACWSAHSPFIDVSFRQMRLASPTARSTWAGCCTGSVSLMQPRTSL